MGSDAVVRGFLVGGGVGALLALLASGGGEEEEAIVHVSFEKYPYVAADPYLQSILPELAGLFSSTDPASTATLLEGLDELSGAYSQCRSEAHVALFAEALRARRKASGALARLTRLARQRAPAAASELAEDLQALQKHLADTVHNIDQEIGFQLSSRS